MKTLFNFGISQDDSRSEIKFLQPTSSDRVLCVASGGEVPLDLAASCENIRVDAIDTDPNQLFLSQLKFKSALFLDPPDAALLIGYTSGKKEQRLSLFRSLQPHLSEDELAFWKKNQLVFDRGPVHAGRFEQYIRKFHPVATAILGKKHLQAMLHMNSLDEQKSYFDHYFRTGLIKGLFKLAFHPRIYKNRGVVEKGLQHSESSRMADFFYSRFRRFCLSNLAVKNGYYQFTFFNEIIYPAALPDYLQDDRLKILRQNATNLRFILTDIRDQLSTNPEINYSKIALSNLSDWVSQAEMNSLLTQILSRSEPSTRIFARYIHAPIFLPDEWGAKIRIRADLVKELEDKERYPFYSLVPMEI